MKHFTKENLDFNLIEKLGEIRYANLVKVKYMKKNGTLIYCEKDVQDIIRNLRWEGGKKETVNIKASIEGGV